MSKPDHIGTDYKTVLGWFHKRLRPKTYLEIGTQNGFTLSLATCASIAIDPQFQISSGATVNNKPACHLFQMPSDDFFESHQPSTIFGRLVDLAFLDGMHRCEFLLRDFMHTEPHCKQNSVILLHDCLPLDEGMTSRVQGTGSSTGDRRYGWWTGDVWRTALALKRYRPDLEIAAYDAQPTGLIAITNLDPQSTLLADRYSDIVRDMRSWTLDLDAYFREVHVESTDAIATEEKMNTRFWL
ncbi:class I SAM-dependent methyltransferase [Acidisoma silvae]|uniref:Class I SAM-dependent methyltransferase n=1 Tax=Acidisoma silvae TaxID=2802396 RepID=A0A963YUE9_9PROT|nr:class I SAM-dependent methyltransferase [Acidisoma silvae]MCB8877266.1 class I SAM-dependent methyltransferase [Acidisoma silvae]